MLMYQDTSGSDTSSIDSTLSSPQAVAAAAREGLTSHRLSAATFKTNSCNKRRRRRRRIRNLTFTALQQQQMQHASSPPPRSHSSGDQNQLPLERNLSWTVWAGSKMKDSVLRSLWPAVSSITSKSTDTPPVSPPSSPVEKRNPHSSSSVPRLSSPLTQHCRHYTHGGISAHPTRRDALENVACAARLQLASCSLHTSTTPYPGHISISSHNSGKSQGSTTTNNNNNDDAGQSAVASVGLDGDCPQSVRDFVTDEHLVAFGALIGEKACLTAARDINLPSPVESSLDTTAKHSPSSSSTLLGVTDHPEIWLHSSTSEGGPQWEPIVSRTEGGLMYRAWRLPLRNGLYAYKTSATFLDVSPRDLRPFHLDDNARLVWDECALSIDRLQPVFESESGFSSSSSSDASPPSITTTTTNNNWRLSKHSEWCLHKYVSKFPRPMAARQYVYARRVWHRPCDGGCYAISSACTVPFLPTDPSSRVVDVKEYVSGCVIRSVTVDNDSNNNSSSRSRMGTELLSIYFEDGSVRAGLAKMAVPKALWPYIHKYDVALRQFADTRANQHHHHHSESGGETSSSASSSSSSGSPCPRSVASLPIMMRGEDDDVASVTSDDGLDKVYAQLKNKSKKKRRYYGIGRQGKRAGSSPYYNGSGGNNTRWLKKVAVAAALKMLHVILTN